MLVVDYTCTHVQMSSSPGHVLAIIVVRSNCLFMYGGVSCQPIRWMASTQTIPFEMCYSISLEFMYAGTSNCLLSS